MATATEGSEATTTDLDFDTCMPREFSSMSITKFVASIKVVVTKAEVPHAANVKSSK